MARHGMEGLAHPFSRLGIEARQNGVDGLTRCQVSHGVVLV